MVLVPESVRLPGPEMVRPPLPVVLLLTATALAVLVKKTPSELLSFSVGTVTVLPVPVTARVPALARVRVLAAGALIATLGPTMRMALAEKLPARAVDAV